KEQTLYDLLSKKMTKNIKENNFTYNKEDNGTKLYLEPAFLKAERSLMKLCLDEDYFDYISKLISKEELILPEHKEIFSIIKDAKKGNINNIVTFLESRCTNVKTIEEVVKIKEQHVLIGNNNKKLIQDFIKQLDNYKLNQKLEELKRKQKLLELEGKIEESIQIAIELKKVNEQLKRGAK
ncbi:DNA primase, partial [Clostridium perfringens]|nr:DNA primase [Clostridium perfringens]